MCGVRNEGMSSERPWIGEAFREPLQHVQVTIARALGGVVKVLPELVDDHEHRRVHRELVEAGEDELRARLARVHGVAQVMKHIRLATWSAPIELGSATQSAQQRLRDRFALGGDRGRDDPAIVDPEPQPFASKRVGELRIGRADDLERSLVGGLGSRAEQRAEQMRKRRLPRAVGSGDRLGAGARLVLQRDRDASQRVDDVRAG